MFISLLFQTRFISIATKAHNMRPKVWMSMNCTEIHSHAPHYCLLQEIQCRVVFLVVLTVAVAYQSAHNWFHQCSGAFKRCSENVCCSAELNLWCDKKGGWQASNGKGKCCPSWGEEGEGRKGGGSFTPNRPQFPSFLSWTFSGGKCAMIMIIMIIH